MKKDPNKIGDIAELIACAWLMQEGYEVFRNVSSTGKVDLMAWKGLKIVLIDVKRVRVKDGKLIKPSQSLESVNLRRAHNIKILYVGENGVCEWEPDQDTLKRKCRECRKEYLPVKKAVFCSDTCSQDYFKKTYPEAYQKQQEIMESNRKLNNQAS